MMRSSLLSGHKRQFEESNIPKDHLVALRVSLIETSVRNLTVI